MRSVTRPRRARLFLAVVSTGAALAISGCGGSAADPTEIAADGGGAAGEPDETPDPTEFREGPVPDELHPQIDVADLPEEPESDDPLSDRMAWTALREITEFGGEVDPDAEASCPDMGGESGEAVTCEVSYLDADIEYEIEIEDSESVLRYESTADGMPLVRDVMEAGLRSYADTEYTVCDMGEVELVTPNEDSGIECRALDEARGAIVNYVIQPTDSGAPTFVNEETEYS